MNKIDSDCTINFSELTPLWALRVWELIEEAYVPKTSHEKLWQDLWDNLFKPDCLLTKEDRIKIVLSRYNYNELSYWERESLIKELKETYKDKDLKELEKLKDIFNSLRTKTLFNKTLKQTTRELRTLTFLKNIFGNNSTEKPNN